MYESRQLTRYLLRLEQFSHSPLDAGAFKERLTHLGFHVVSVALGGEPEVANTVFAVVDDVNRGGKGDVFRCVKDASVLPPARISVERFCTVDLDTTWRTQLPDVTDLPR